MRTYRVKMIGSDTWIDVEAHSESLAVAAVAECAWVDVCLPIWMTSAGSCYMPLDDSGRQWLVGEVLGE